MDVVQRNRRCLPVIDNAMGGGNNDVRRNERSAALSGRVEAADIDLADGIPRRAALLDENAMVLAEDGCVKLVVHGRCAQQRGGAQCQQKPPPCGSRLYSRCTIKISFHVCEPSDVPLPSPSNDDRRTPVRPCLGRLLFNWQPVAVVPLCPPARRPTAASSLARQNDSGSFCRKRLERRSPPSSGDRAALTLQRRHSPQPRRHSPPHGRHSRR